MVAVVPGIMDIDRVGRIIIANANYGMTLEI
jgi:hypothetical protein